MGSSTIRTGLVHDHFSARQGVEDDHMNILCVGVGTDIEVSLGWAHYIGTTGSFTGMTTFGASAPLKVLQKEFGFTKEHVVEAAIEQLKRGGHRGLVNVGI